MKWARRMFGVVAVASGVVCLALVGMWVRSGWVMDFWVRDFGGGRSGSISSGAGQILITREQFDPNTTAKKSTPWVHATMPIAGWGPTPMWKWTWASHRHSARTSPFAFERHEWHLPYWPVIAATAVLAGGWGAALWRGRRKRPPSAESHP